MKSEKLIQEILELIKQCKERMLQASREGDYIETKEGHANFVTEYDKKNQEILREGLLKLLPGAVFVGEEDEKHEGISEGICFIVDPIDGTTNFIRDFHASTVSVGILKDGIPWIGVIGNPYTDEYFYAERGEGAFLNGKRIHASKRPLSESLILFGSSPYYPELQERSFRFLRKLSGVALDVRRTGSAALDLCYIASGRAEVFFEMRLSPWDYAAGTVIITEAGGRITTVENTPVTFDACCSILARGAGITDGDIKED